MPTPAASRTNRASASQNEPVSPTPIAASAWRPAAHSSSVVRRPQNRETKSTSTLPAIIAPAITDAAAPAAQMASRPSSRRKYGCQA